MAKASYNNTTRRAALSACLVAAVVPMIAATPASSGTPPGALRPTKLGLELLRRLPAYAEAVWIDVKTCDDHSCPPEIQAARQEAYDEAHDRIADAIEAIRMRAAEAPLDHLIDVAIVLSVCSEDPIDTVEEATLEMVGALGEDGALMLAKTLALALLKLAQIPTSACSVDGLYQTLERSRIEYRAEPIAGTA